MLLFSTIRPIKSDFGYHILIVWERNFQLSLYGIRPAWMMGVPEMYQLFPKEGLQTKDTTVYADPESIKSGFVKLAKIFHPDPEPTMAPTKEERRRLQDL